MLTRNQLRLRNVFQGETTAEISALVTVNINVLVNALVTVNSNVLINANAINGTVNITINNNANIKYKPLKKVLFSKKPISNN